MKSVYSDDYRCVIKALIKARKDANLTQQQVADLLDKPQSYVAKYEICERRIDIVELKEICEAIGADIHDIIKEMY